MSKGSQYERELTVPLSIWWTDGASDSIFWRTSNSGGRAKTRSKTGKKTINQYGDIHAVDPIGQPLIDFFTIEIKRGYSSHTIANLMDKSNNTAKQMYEKWFDKLLIDTELSGSNYWMLIVRRDRKIPIIFIPEGAYFDLIHYGSFKTGESLGMFCSFKFGKLGYPKIMSMTLDDFFNKVNPEHIKKIAGFR